MNEFESLLRWANLNKNNGCNRKDMKVTAISSGWQEEIVEKVLSIAFGDLSESIPYPDLSNKKTSIIAGGKKIKIALTLTLPKVVLFENFLSDAECDTLIELSKNQLTRSSGFNNNTGVGELTEARTSSGTFFRKGSVPLVDEIDKRIAEAVNWPVENGEDLQILHYENGERYIPHHDFFFEEYEGSKSTLQRGGNRVATFLMYLETPEEGGLTSFPESGINVYPQKGNALFFAYPTPTRDTKTLHGGEPVTVGEKYVATKWLRQGEFK